MGKFTRPTVIPADQYEARHVRIDTKENKETGEEFNIWVFDADSDGTTVELTQSSSMNTGPKSKAGKWAAALLGRAPTDDEIDNDLAVLAGLHCRLIVGIDPDSHYNVIEAVLPPRTPRPVAQAAPAPEAPPSPPPAVVQTPTPAPAATTPDSDVPDALPF
jgi:hypothetical protein